DMNERILPHNIEAEQAVIGAIFLEPNAFSTALERIVSKDFYRANHQVIIEAMLNLYETVEQIDMVTVTTLLSNSDKLEIAGGVPYLTDVAGSVPTAANIDYYSQIVEEKAVLRRLIQTASDIVTNTFSKEDEVEEALDDAERTILEVSS